MRKQHKAWFDGGSTPNPGIMKIGGFIQDPQTIEIFRYSKTLGHGTNNEAEYKSLIKLMEEAKRRGIKKLHIQGDSALVVNQVTGTWKAKDPRMKALRDQVLQASEGIEYVLGHVLRKFNAEADSLT